MTLLDDLETEARERAVTLHAQGKLGRLTGTTLMDVLGYDRLTISEARELRRLKNCAALATDVDTFVALCKSRQVHVSRLQPELVKLLRRG